MPRTLAWRLAGLDHACQSSNRAILLTSLLFVFEISFLPMYRVNYYDYFIKWCFGIALIVLRLSRALWFCINDVFLYLLCQVLCEYAARGGDGKAHLSDERLLAKFQKKISSNPKVKLHKEKVKLVKGK